MIAVALNAIVAIFSLFYASCNFFFKYIYTDPLSPSVKTKSGIRVQPFAPMTSSGARGEQWYWKRNLLTSFTSGTLKLFANYSDMPMPFLKCFYLLHTLYKSLFFGPVGSVWSHQVFRHTSERLRTQIMSKTRRWGWLQRMYWPFTNSIPEAVFANVWG